MTTSEKRLTDFKNLPEDIETPKYNPADFGVGIVHLGPGAFHKAHQAVYTDETLAAKGGNWRFAGVDLRMENPKNELNPQNGLYSVLEKAPEGTHMRVVGSISHAYAPGDLEEIMALMIDEKIKIVSLTITEKGYYIDRKTGGVDLSIKDIEHDLANPDEPKSAIGLIVAALKKRREKGIAPFTVLSCDNLPGNGKMLEKGAIDYAKRLDPELGEWVAKTIAFPCTMVDRITPAQTVETRTEAEQRLGYVDLAAIETEGFRQWIIENKFTNGRPEWEVAGALFVEDVEPYEHMKLRMLNGSHSMLAYSGFLSGCKYVRDVMADADLASLVDRHMKAAAATLPPLADIDFEDYRKDLLNRFTNLAIAHETYQISMDGSQKLPQRLLEPAMETQEAGGDIRPFAFAVAAWMRYTLGKTESGQAYALRDPREDEIRAAIDGKTSAKDISEALHNLEGLFKPALKDNKVWRDNVEACLDAMIKDGVKAAIAQEAKI